MPCEAAALSMEDAAPAGRRERTKVANRQAILAAARAVFAELGYDAATVRDIIRQTELSVGAFYNYYRSKEEVYEALADDGARRFRPVLRAAFEQADDFESYLYAGVGAYYRFLVFEEEAWRVSRPPGEAHPPVLMGESPEMRAVFEEVKSSIARVIERGLAPRVDAEYLAAACIAVAREVGEKMIERRPVDVDGAVAFAVRMILGGLPALPRLEETPDAAPGETD